MVHLTPWLCWSLPIIGALLTPLFAKIHHKIRDYVAVLFSLSAAISAASLIPNLLTEEYYNDVLIAWIDFPGYRLSVGVLVDPLSIIMANVVAFISFLIMVYSLGYMRGDPCLTRYWFLMNLFIGNMLLLVLSDNLVQVLIGWEGVGLCSYALIGFYYRDRRERWLGGPPSKAPMFPPSECGMKAFVMTGIGDVLLLAAIFILFTFAGTFSFRELFASAPKWLAEMNKFPGLLALTSLLLLGGPIGKSAQFPLHEWLPEAMAGPTPVSALIHAATMVKAGVYFVARVLPIFYTGFWVLHYAEALVFFIVVAGVGAFTALLAGTQAMVSLELKKVLAYSTVSQIGYMMLGLGCAGLSPNALLVGYAAGIFHLVSHALFKATLFLSAGSVLHVSESIYMPHMGGLRKIMPFTHAFMLIAALSLSGIPPLSGFWSKDAVLIASLESGQYVLFALGAITAAVTIFYSIRFLAMTFWWKKSSHLEELEHELKREGKHLHEASPVMWAPYGILTVLIILVGLAGVGGLIGFTGPEQFLHEKFQWLVHEYISAPQAQIGIIASTSVAAGGGIISPHVIGLSTSLIMLAIGGVASYRIYIAQKPNPDDLIEKHGSLRALWSFLWNRWYLNQAYYKIFVNGTLKVSKAVFNAIEQGVIDKISGAIAKTALAVRQVIFDVAEKGVVDKISGAIAHFTIAVSAFSYRIIERRGIDTGLNVGIPSLATSIYHKIKKVQTGILSYNMLYITLTLLIILLAVLLWGV